MKPAGLAFVAALTALGVFPALAIDGTVVNQTTGKPQAGATVTLYKLGQDGMESVQSVKSDAQGKFEINQDMPGPRLLQTAFDGVTYNHMLPPGSPTTGLSLEVFNSSKQPGDARVAQHMVLFEPSAAQMVVSETYLFRNSGKITYNDPDGGTLKFYLPAAAKGIVQVNCTAPQGMPIQRAADKTSRPDIYKVDFPIKPGETRIDLNYLVPFADGTTFEGKILSQGGPTRLVTPNGVTLKGEQIASVGAEPRTQANIYEVKGSTFKVQINGTGTLRGSSSADGDSGDSQDNGPSIEQVMPKVWDNMTWILGLALGILALGFTLLYRAEPAGQAASAGHSAPAAAAKGKNDRRRR
ncbi:MAG TPA: carboxypeptidase-like regulatory domain-containing protein [Bryobacteraceae bacterium]|nr:carboxypeptidase-like regulatory domain-containing protein [Bryobacteraceae bacterium]